MSLEGKLVGERYRLIRKIGAGGMGTVYEGVDTKSETGQQVAVKFLRGDIVAHNPDLVERFAREGHALSQLKHRNIVQLLDSFEEDQQHFLVMEYVSGGDLYHLMKRGRLTLKRVLEIALDLSDALIQSHRLDIIHRDIKPANVLMGDDGVPRLTDFGVAHVGSLKGITRTGLMIGTLDYLSPEALNGDIVDQRADIWSFGVMLFEMLTHRRPFRGANTMQLMTQIMTIQTPDLQQLRPEVPFELMNLIEQMLQKKREDRVASMRRVALVLEDVKEGRIQPPEEMRPTDPVIPPPGEKVESGESVEPAELADKPTTVPGPGQQIDVALPSSQTRNPQERQYLENYLKRYDYLEDLYTDLAVVVEGAGSSLRASAIKHLDSTTAFGSVVSTGVPDNNQQTLETFEILFQHVLKNRRLVLTGPPGAGKTTTLQRLTLALTYEARARTDVPLPVYVPLSSYEGGDFDQFVDHHMEVLRAANYMPKQVFLLLDGFNEMSGTHRQAFLNWLSVYQELSFVMTCTRTDYDAYRLAFHRADILPLDEQRIYTFIGKYLSDQDRDVLFRALPGSDVVKAWHWYRQTRENVTWQDFFRGDDMPGSDWEPERKTMDGVRKSIRLDRHLPGMLGVVSNPFLLYIAISIYNGTGQPPTNRGQLISDFVHMLLQKQNSIVGNNRDILSKPDSLQAALAALAYRIQTDDVSPVLRESQVLDVFMAQTSDDTAQTLLTFALNAGLLERSGEAIRFTHQLLREYFAAYSMSQDIHQGVSASRYFAAESWWEVSGWEETALLLAGMEQDATAIVRWLTPVQPSLAFRIVRESGATCDDAVLARLLNPPEEARRSPEARQYYGRQLAEQGDTRPGVGLRSDGLPDIQWGKSLPPGIYPIGGDPDARDPLPAQQWQLDYALKLAKYPVTQMQFQAFLDAPDGFNNGAWWGDMPAKYRQQAVMEWSQPGANYPCDNITWYQAVAFTRWLTARYWKKGLLPHYLVIRLPLEKEWEAVARYPDGRVYTWDNTYRPASANIDEHASGTGPFHLNETTAVGMYAASQADLYDLCGNIMEWCLNDNRNPDVFSVSNNAWKTLRGGSFFHDEVVARLTSRAYDYPYQNLDWYGFRVVRSKPIPAMP